MMDDSKRVLTDILDEKKDFCETIELCAPVVIGKHDLFEPYFIELCDLPENYKICKCQVIIRDKKTEINCDRAEISITFNVCIFLHITGDCDLGQYCRAEHVKDDLYCICLPTQEYKKSIPCFDFYSHSGRLSPDAFAKTDNVCLLLDNFCILEEIEGRPNVVVFFIATAKATRNQNVIVRGTVEPEPAFFSGSHEKTKAAISNAMARKYDANSVKVNPFDCEEDEE